MKLFITGHNGFLGKNLVQRLSKDHKVICFNGDIKEEIDLYSSDIFEADKIVHLAAKNRGNEKDLIETNIGGSINIIQLAKEYNIPLIIAGTNYPTDCAYKMSKDLTRDLCCAYDKCGLNSIYFSIPKLIGPQCKPHYNSFTTTLIYLASINQLKNKMYLIKDINEELELLCVNDVCDTIIEESIDKDFIGFINYKFTKYDNLFSIKMKDLIDILNGKTDHEHSDKILNILNWYKENNHLYGQH